MDEVFQGAVRVLEKERVCDETVRIRLEPLSGEMPAPRPGQFGMLAVKAPEWPAQLQRPFSFSSPGEMVVRVAYHQDCGCPERLAGRASSYIVNRLEPGELALLSCPLGRGFLDFEPDDMYYLIGGGCGMPPLYFLARELRKGGDGAGFLAMTGARTKSGLLLPQGLDASELMVATDDGTEGCKGTVVEMMDKYGKFKDGSTFCICGPKNMLKPAAEAAGRHTSPDKILLDVETYMGCGRGVCNKCGVAGYNACSDGPVFRYSDIKDSDFFDYEALKSGSRRRIG